MINERVKYTQLRKNTFDILTSKSREIDHSYILVKNVVGDFQGKAQGFCTRSQCERHEI